MSKFEVLVLKALIALLLHKEGTGPFEVVVRIGLALADDKIEKE